MNKFLAIVCLCYFFVVGISNAQEWININPTFTPPGKYNLSFGTFLDKNNGWFIESFPGRIWHTTNGGNLWEIKKDSSDVWIYAIEFVDTSYGLVVGKKILDYSNFLWKTTDIGNSWEEISTPEFNTLTFIDSLTGFSGGENAIYRTTDGGESWQAQSIEPGVRFGIWDIYFVDEQYGWAVGGRIDVFDSGIILNTVDGGETWHVQLPETLILQAVYFNNRMQGYAVGFNVFWEGVIMRTNDGGENWEDNYLQSSFLNDVVFVNDSTGWVVGDYGFIWHTKDSGDSWEQVESGTNADLNRIIFVENGEVGYIFGDNNTLLRYDRTTDVKGDDAIVPSILKLYQNYPNPFNPSTIIKYQIPQKGFVTLKVYDILGRNVVTLVNKNQNAGEYEIDFHKSELSSGVYIYRITVNTEGSNSFTSSKKMLLLK